MDRDTFQRLLMESTYGPTIPSRFGAYAVLRDFGDTLPESDQKASTTPAPAEVALHEALWVMSHAIDVLSIQRRTDDNYILLQNLLAWRERIADYIAPPGAVEAIPPEPQPQQDLKTLLKDWVGGTLEALQQGHWNREDDGAVLFRQFQSLATLLGDTDAAGA